ncbi:MAG: hypothetical protein QOG43_2948 [Actinomycetota bacterium]|jgi:hypothetical protein|nr:hypothetical protein [Actinomycetota bacterium]
MGSVYEDLEGHEGFAMRRLPDGTMTGSWTAEAAVCSSYVAACECSWRGGDHAPTEKGYEEAIGEWDRRHAQPLLAQAVPRNVRRVVREMKQILNDLVDERPAAGLRAIREVAQWANAIDAQASGVEEAPVARPSGGRPNRRPPLHT